MKATLILPVLALDYDTLEDLHDMLPANGDDRETAGQIAEARERIQMALDLINESTPENEDAHGSLEDQDAELARRYGERGQQ